MKSIMMQSIIGASTIAVLIISNVSPQVTGFTLPPNNAAITSTGTNSISHQKEDSMKLFLHQNEPSGEDNNNNEEEQKSQVLFDRRHYITKMASAATMLTSVTVGKPQPSNAACLSGDPSPECIGVYKLPLDDNVLSYIDTPEHLSTYAPDLKWVPPVEYPKSFSIAMDELTDSQTKVVNVKELVLKGDLVNAGTLLLSLVPRITVAGRVVIGSIRQKESSSTITPEERETLSMRAYRSEVAHYDLLANLGETDIMIGQTLNGRFGSLTMAQIQLLDTLKEADGSFNDLMKAIPKEMNL